MSEGTQRRLAAIVSADVVGYSRLMGADETGTLATLKSHRSELIDPLIEKHGGRIVKTTGDGLLLEFPSVVAAVECSIAVQDGMAARNTALSDDTAIRFRIGVHLGDIIVEGDDIFGDGVNVAARLETLSDVSGLALSDDAYRQVRDRIDIDWQDGGEHAVKNIARPVHVWRWSPEAIQALAPPKWLYKDPVPTDKPSVAVLPFANMSRDAEYEYFADGIAEDIITALSKVSRMRVIARNSTFAYKDQAHDLHQVAKTLEVRYVLEGSVRSGGNRLRITAQLIDASDGSHLWAERYDRTVDDIFDIQDQITKEIVTALRVKLTDGEEAGVLSRGTNNIEAWQLCVRAFELFMRFSPTEYLESRALAQRAVEKDPDYAYAWATLGATYWFEGRLGYTGDPAACFARANEYAERAMALDDTLSWAIGVSVVTSGSLGLSQESVEKARRGFELNPGCADIRSFLAFALIRVGEYREAEEHLRAGMSLNPFFPNWYRVGLSRVLMILDEFEEALALVEDALRAQPGSIVSRVNQIYLLGQLGRSDEARRAIGDFAHHAPNFRLEHVPGELLIDDPAAIQKIVDGLREVGFPE